MKRLLMVLLLSTASSYAATGDITGAGVNANSVAEIYVEGFPTNATFNNGFLNYTNYSDYDGTNEMWYQGPSTTNGVMFVVQSLGYNHGTNYTWTRTNYATKLARKAYNNEAQSAIFTNGGSPNIARIALWTTDFFYSNDTAVVYVTTNAFASNNAVANFPVTNISTLLQWTPKCNIMNPGWENIYNSNYVSRIVAYDHYRIDGVGVVLTHTNGQTKSNYSMVRVEDVRDTRGQHAAVFTNMFDLSDWTNAPFTVDFVVKPTIGVQFSTYDNLYTGDMPQPQRITNLLNHAGELTPYIGVYDQTAVGPGVVTNVAPELVDPAHYFTSCVVGSQRVVSSNNYYGGKLFWKTGSTNIGAPSASYARDSASRLEWRPFPGDTMTIITNTTGGGINPGGRLLISDATILMTGANTVLLDNCERVYLTNCTVDTTASIPFRASSVNCIVYIENSHIRRLGQGLRPFSTDKLAYQVVGNNLNGFTNIWVPWLAVGNWHTNTVSTNFVIDTGPSQLPFPPQQRIFAHNYIVGMAGDSTSCGEFGDTTFAATNDAVVLNVMEGIAFTGGAAKSLTLWASPTNMVGHVIHNNDLYGFRHQFAYNETGQGWKQVSCKNNNIDLFGWVTDAIGGANNSSYTQNWWAMNFVGCTGNAIPNTSPVNHGDAEYAHFESYWRPNSFKKPYTWWGVSDRQALSSGTVYARGNGDYHRMPYALIRRIPIDNLYEFDIEFRPYAETGSGAYATRNYTKVVPLGTSTIVDPSGGTTTFIQQ